VVCKILEKITFLHFIVADISDWTIDNDKNRLIIDNLIGWEIAQKVPITSSYLNIARIAFSKARKHGFSEHDFQLLVDYLALHLSRANMYSLANDLQKLADIDDSLSLEENNFLQLLHETWQLEEDFKHHQNKELLAGHYAQNFRVDQEKAISEALRKIFQVESLLPAVRAKELELSKQFHDDHRQLAQLADEITSPRLIRLSKEVCGALEIENNFKIFIINEPYSQAYIYSALSSYAETFIALSSELINQLSDIELKFVLGHEIGHWIFNNTDLNILCSSFYSEDFSKPSYSFDNLLSTWSKLAEFSADRIGLLACGSEESSITALYRVISGLDPDKSEFDCQKYKSFHQNSEISYNDLKAFRKHSHPTLELRVRALSTFASSETFENWRVSGRIDTDDIGLANKITELVKIIDFSAEQPLYFKRILVVTLAGFILAGADGEVSEDELIQVEDSLLNFVLNPAPVIDYVKNMINDHQLSLGVLLRDLIDELNHLNEDSFEDLMQVLVGVALSDGELKPSETSTLVELGISMGLSPQKTMSIITREIGRENFLEKRIPHEISQIFSSGEIFHSGTYSEKIEMAENPQTNIKVLFRLGRDLSFDVRSAVLFNPSTPDELRLEILDSSPSILERTLAKLD
jgi:uncharacterized tellurite resistance protein B-like protein